MPPATSWFLKRLERNRISEIQKTKKLEALVKLFENEQLVKDIHIISRPHMRLYKIEDVHKIIK